MHEVEFERRINRKLKLVKDSISEQIYSIIKEEILLAKRKPGEQINPRKLADEFETSVMPIRDALNQLANEGLVIRKPRVGFFVRSFTPKEAKDLMEVRKLYELYCLEKYFDKIDRKKLSDYLDRSLEKIDISYKDREFDELDENIHDLIVKASNNSWLINGYNSIKNYIVVLKHLDTGQVQAAQREHISLINAILDGDKEKAMKVLEEHIQRVTEELMMSLISQ
jgi:DNA-binding GntR family transcriptional regulator